MTDIIHPRKARSTIVLIVWYHGGPYGSIYRPKTGGVGLPDVFLKAANVGSVGNISPTAKIAQTTFCIRAVASDLRGPTWVFLDLFWASMRV